MWTMEHLILFAFIATALARVDLDNDDKCVGQNGHCYYCLYHDGKCYRSDTCNFYQNGIIYTVDSNDANWSTAPKEAMIIKDGKILYVGDNTGGSQYLLENGLDQPNVCKTIDLNGKTVLPGLHDVHMHPLEASSTIGGTCKTKKDTWPNKDIFVDPTCFTKQIGTEWVLGHGHSISAFLDYLNSTDYELFGDPKTILDGYIKDKPAIMMEETSHSVWVNTEALKRAGLDGYDPPNWIGSKVMLNADKYANGILLEGAGNILMDMAMDPNKYTNLTKYTYSALTNGLFELAKNGITSFVDARAYYKRGNHLAYEEAEKKNQLTSRAVLSLWFYQNDADESQIQNLQDLFYDPPTGNLKRTQVKVYSDGLIGTMTARVMDDYLYDKLHLGIGLKGFNYVTEDRLAKIIGALQNFRPDGRGFDFHVHTVGNRAVYEVLNACNRTFVPTTRHRCTHVELVSKADIPRFAQLNVIADPQVANNFTMPGDPSREDVASLVGKDLERDYIPVRSLRDAGALVTLSSDWDVSTLNPFVGMSNALHRDPQSVDLKSALSMYTINGAYVMRNEQKTGSLEVGKEADFVIIDRDIFQLEAAKNFAGIKSSVVLQTVVGGEEIFRHAQFSKRY